MDAGLSITPLSIAMFVGCFLLGFIPLLFRFSERSVHFISILGAGLLCGTALAITIPEGVGLLQASWTHRHGHHHIIKVYSVLMNVFVALFVYPCLLAVNATSTERAPSPQLWIGVALTLGFAFMFVVDQLGSYLSLCGQTTPNRGAITATLGLVIHAAADGFALGAVVATGQITVQIIVFLAVILHKVPAAFGLVAFLMHAGLENRSIQGYLFAFSAAAPIVAISTYFILHASCMSSQNQLAATGVGMLFSAGSFLFVATVHVLPDIISSHSHGRAGQDSDHLQQQSHLGLQESLTLVLGVGLPVLLAVGLHDD
ncbi:zinc transporter ZIP9 isoform X1 [Phyllopteryx taeniolatus]|uniref:zinc transporter ZIP9 isoform X1 n=1 Tax=Phyllopteryx taeniolatus TaxID=161469 RepID=UPI002AD3F93D|nr:zinc transporter ZIP9 isoform X1 [Phyllopteryx taeniolatus]